MRMHGGICRLRLLTAKATPGRQIPIPNSRRCIHTHTATQWTTVGKGTAFEHRSLQILAQDLAMDLHRVGGKDDGGVDLIGWWKLPHFPLDPTAATLPERIRVVAQCKAEKKKIGPKYIRELEGVLHEHVHMARHLNSQLFDVEQDALSGYKTDDVAALSPETSWNQFPTIALFISESPFTKSAILRMLSSTVPLLFLHIPPTPSGTSSHDLSIIEDSPIGAVLVNPALAGTRGILRGQVEIRWEWCRQSGEGRPGVWVRGIKVGGLTGEHAYSQSNKLAPTAEHK
ncbi:hypothetical protein AB1N83_008822 [Pleurotus pulmonarius]